MRESGASFAQGVERGFQEYGDRLRGGNRIAIALLGERSAAERDYVRVPRIKTAGSQQGGERLRFGVAEGVLAVGRENLGDGLAAGGFYAIVEVDEGTAEPSGQQASNSGLAAAHETEEDDMAVHLSKILACQ